VNRVASVADFGMVIMPVELARKRIGEVGLVVVYLHLETCVISQEIFLFDDLEIFSGGNTRACLKLWNHSQLFSSSHKQTDSSIFSTELKNGCPLRLLLAHDVNSVATAFSFQRMIS